MSVHILTGKLFIFFLLITPLVSISQSNYKESYVVNATGDTLYGFVDYREWNRNPDKFLFKFKKDDRNTQNFTTANTNSVFVIGHQSYSKFTVSISMGEVRFEKLKEQHDTSSITKSVFLKEVLTGDKVSLYSYQDDIKTRYYMLDKRQIEPTELLYSKTIKDMQESTQSLFRKQLLIAAVELGAFTNDLDRHIQTADYAINDLRNIIIRVNSQNFHTIVPARDKRQSKFGFFVGVGVNNSQTTHSGNSWVTVDGLTESGANKFKNNVVTSGYFPRLSTGFDFYIKPAIGRLIFRTELAVTNVKSTVVSNYRYNNYGSAGIAYTYRFSSWNFSFNPQLVYNVYKTAKFKGYLGAGVALNYFHNTDNSLSSKYINQTSTDSATTPNYLVMQQSALSTTFRIGAQINQRIDLSVIWGNNLEYARGGGVKGASIKARLLALSTACYFKK